MSYTFKSIIKVSTINIAIFLLGFLLIELIFGYWFSKHNLGPYMREHRLKKNPIVLSYNKQTYNYIYKRNYYGFRGENIDPSKIKAVIIGGSTTDERYKPSKFTITENLNNLLKDEGYNFKIINAGVEGQSTFGHMWNFQKWFPKLKNFSPKLFIFYIGINDYNQEEDRSIDDIIGSEGHMENPEAKELFFDNLKSRSFFYDKLRSLKQKYYLTEKTMLYDLDYMKKYDASDYNYINYQEALEIHSIEKLQSKYLKLVSNYLARVKALTNYAKKYGATPVFINQVGFEGSKWEKLFILNYSLIEHCKKNNIYCIDLAKKLNGQLAYWFDPVHTSILGSKAIANVIIIDLLKVLKKENLF